MLLGSQLWQWQRHGASLSCQLGCVGPVRSPRDMTEASPLPGPGVPIAWPWCPRCLALTAGLIGTNQTQTPLQRSCEGLSPRLSSVIQSQRGLAGSQAAPGSETGSARLLTRFLIPTSPSQGKTLPCRGPAWGKQIGAAFLLWFWCLASLALCQWAAAGPRLTPRTCSSGPSPTCLWGGGIKGHLSKANVNGLKGLKWVILCYFALLSIVVVFS